MRFGVVFFDAAIDRRAVRSKMSDAVVQAREGWASVDGCEAFRITKIADLDSDVVWINNLDMKSYTANKLSQSPNHVPRYYLRTDIMQVAAEIGAHTEHERVPVIVQALSDVFARTMRLIQKQFGSCEIGIEHSRKKLEFLLASAVGRKSHPMDAELNEAMCQAWQNRVSVLGQTIPYQWWQCTLRRNRYVHACEVLDTPVPSSSNWEYLDASKLPAGNRARIDWAVNHQLPVLVHARVSDGKGFEASLTSFGSKAKATVTREWLCAPELYWVQRYYSTVEIDAAYVCNDGYATLPELAKFPVPNEFSMASISMGLLAENFLAMMAEPYLMPSGYVCYYPHSVWYTSMDRFMCFVGAAKLIKASSFGNPHAGFRAVSYGQGNLQISAPHEMIDDLTDLAASSGWEVPSTAYWKRTMEYRRHAEGGH